MMTLLFLKLFIAFIFLVNEVMTKEMQGSTRVRLVCVLVFTLPNLFVIGWGALKMRREALAIQSMEMAL